METLENTPANIEEIQNIYQAPQIILELDLETQAGSPLGLPDELDLLGE